MEYGVLGPVSLDGGPLGSPQLRRLVAALLAARQQVLSHDALVDVVWGERPPPAATNALQSKMSRLRRQLPPDALVYVPPGYVLKVDEGDDEVDADVFVDLLDQADGLIGDEAVALYDAALGCWRGPAYVDLLDHALGESQARRLESLRLSAEEGRLRALLEATRYESALAGVERLLALEPYRDLLCSFHMQALTALGRSVDALRAYERHRERLARDLGLRPSKELAALVQTILVAPTAPVGLRSPDEPRAAATAGGSGPARGAARRWRGRIRHPAELIGPTAFALSLRSLPAEALEGATGVVCVRGERGVGKSQVLTEILAALPEDFATAVIDFAPDTGFPWAVAVSRLRPWFPADADPESLPEPAQLAEWLHAGAASHGPLVVAFEDVQWADEPVLELLVELAAQNSVAERTRTVSPILVLCSLRTPIGHDGRRRQIDRLLREPAVQALDVVPLDEPDVYEFVRQSTGATPSVDLAHALAEVTGGNPLLLLAALRKLAADGELRIRGGLLSTERLPLPPDLLDMDAMAASLVAHLPERCRTLLEALAVGGRAVPLALLAAVSGRTAAAVAEDLGPAEDVGLVALDEGARFQHELYLRAIQYGVSPSRARALHAAYAEALGGATGGQPGAFIGETVRHLARSEAVPSEDRPLVEWAAEAGGACLRHGSWSLASEYYGYALTWSDAPPPPLLFAAGRAAFHDNDLHKAADLLAQASHAAAARRDLQIAGEALLLRHRAVMAADPHHQLSGIDELQAFLREAGDDVPDLRARVLAQMAEYAFTQRRFDDGLRWGRAATALARGSGHAELRIMTALGQGLAELGALQLAAAEASFREAWAVESEASAWFRGGAATRLGLIALLRGEQRAAEEWLATAATVNRDSRNWAELSFSRSLDTVLAVVRGDARQVAVYGRESGQLFQRSGYAYTPHTLYPALAAHAVETKDLPAARRALEEWASVSRFGFEPYFALLDAIEGTAPDDGDDERPLRHVEDVERVDLLTVGPVVARAQAALVRADEVATKALVPVVERVVEAGVALTVGWPIDVPALLAAMDDLLGERRASSDR